MRGGNTYYIPPSRSMSIILGQTRQTWFGRRMCSSGHPFLNSCRWVYFYHFFFSFSSCSKSDVNRILHFCLNQEQFYLGRVIAIYARNLNGNSNFLGWTLYCPSRELNTFTFSYRIPWTVLWYPKLFKLYGFSLENFILSLINS